MPLPNAVPFRRPAPYAGPHPHAGPNGRRCALGAFAWVLVHAAVAGATPGAPGTVGVAGVAEPVGTAEPARPAAEDIAATWYADGSCTLAVAHRSSTGKAAIDADFDEIGARTLVHCDTEDGQRVTVLSRGGEALALGERTVLLSPHEVDAGLDGSIAWLAQSGEGFADETAPRRFVLEGKVLIRATPVTESAGAAPHTDKQPFAELTGRVESLVRDPFADEAASGPDSGPAAGAAAGITTDDDAPKRAAVNR